MRALNRALADDTDQTANDLVPAMFTVAELLAYVQFKNDLKQVFGTASCHPHPGMFFLLVRRAGRLRRSCNNPSEMCW